jgi:cystathionine beta-synthase
VKKKVCDTILDAVGDTPLVRINHITRGVVKGTVYAKVETFGLATDRDRGDPDDRGCRSARGSQTGGTSSWALGNTGMGLADGCRRRVDIGFHARPTSNRRRRPTR